MNLNLMKEFEDLDYTEREVRIEYVPVVAIQHDSRPESRNIAGLGDADLESGEGLWVSGYLGKRKGTESAGWTASLLTTDQRERRTGTTVEHHALLVGQRREWSFPLDSAGDILWKPSIETGLGLIYTDFDTAYDDSLMTTFYVGGGLKLEVVDGVALTTRVLGEIHSLRWIADSDVGYGLLWSVGGEVRF